MRKTEINCFEMNIFISMILLTIFQSAHCYYFIIELTHSKTILGNTVEIKAQPVALDFKNLSKNLSKNLVVPSKTVFWICAVSALIPICFNLLPNCLVIAPNEPTTNDMIFTLTFNIFCSSLPNSWYFSVLSFSFSPILLSPGTARWILFYKISVSIECCILPTSWQYKSGAQTPILLFQPLRPLQSRGK